MRAKEMKAGECLDIIQEILDWKTFDESDKRYMIYSFLNGWSEDERIHELTERDKYNIERDKERGA